MSTKKSVFFGFIAAFFILTPLFVIFSSKFANKPILKKGEIISGKIDLNGYVPDKATIEIGERERGTDKFTIVAQNLPAQDGAMWYWAESQKNKNYELQAYLKQNDKTISSSGIITVTAPATEEVLTINSKLNVPIETPNPSPAVVPSESEVTKEGRRAMLSGTIDLNGNIPAGSVLEIMQRRVGEPVFQIAVTENTPADGISWVWKGARVGAEYETQALLKDQDTVIGESQILKVTAPALNEVLAINSIAAPPAPTTTSISGKINLNGSLPQGTSDTIVIFQRVRGTDKYEVAQDSIVPSDGALWSWNNAVSGTTYELLAILKDNNQKDIANSNLITVSAPAQNEVFTVNTGQTLNPPSGTPSIKCTNQISNSQWNVAMTVPSYNNASEYLLQIGSSSGSYDVLNSRVDLSGNINAGATVNNNTPYYARYAYAFCTNCSYNTFSAFSSVITFQCPPLPPTPAPATPTPAPKPTQKPEPTPEPTVAPTPPPTPEPTEKPKPTKEPEPTAEAPITFVP